MFVALLFFSHWLLTYSKIALNLFCPSCLPPFVYTDVSWSYLAIWLRFHCMYACHLLHIDVSRPCFEGMLTNFHDSPLLLRIFFDCQVSLWLWLVSALYLWQISSLRQMRQMDWRPGFPTVCSLGLTAQAAWAKECQVKEVRRLVFLWRCCHQCSWQVDWSLRKLLLMGQTCIRFRYTFQLYKAEAGLIKCMIINCQLIMNLVMTFLINLFHAGCTYLKELSLILHDYEHHAKLKKGHPINICSEFFHTAATIEWM